MSLMDTLYASTQGLENPENVLGGVQSMPTVTGTQLQSDMGKQLGSIQDGAIEGQQTFHDAQGGYEGYSRENVHGGQDYFNEQGELLASTQDGVMGETVFSGSGSYEGTISSDGMGGEEFINATGQEMLSSQNTTFGQEIEPGGFGESTLGSAEGLGADFGDAGTMGDFGDAGELGDVGDLDGLADAGDIGDFGDFM